MYVTRLWLEFEQQLLAYATATAAGSKLCLKSMLLTATQILNLLSEARDQTRFLMDTMTGTPQTF